MTKNELIDDIELYLEYSDGYYNNNTIVSDSTFDALKRKIESKRDEYPTLVGRIDVVGSTSELHSLKHTVRMYSLDNLFNIAELRVWMSKYPLARYSLEYKYDGASLDVGYKDGKVQYAISRGDGSIGMEVTDHVMHAVPVQIDPSITTLHGEVYISFKEFTRANDRRVADGEAPYLSPRNAASAEMMRGKGYAKLTFTPYAMFSSQGRLPADLYRHFKTPYSLVGDMDTILTQAEKLYNSPTTSIPVDGLVIKIVDDELIDKLGHNNKYPKWAIALKFPELDKETILEDVVWQVGHTGNITPVGILNPVKLHDCTVSRVTLNNMQYVLDIKLGYKDTVLIIRSGGVIPKLTGVLRKATPHIPIIIPSKCPSCNSPTSIEGPMLKCNNLECRDRVISKLSRCVSRDHYDIKGVSTKTITSLYHQGVTSIADLMQIDITLLSKVDGMGDRSISNILLSISKVRNLEMNRFLSGLGIEGLGKTNSRILAEHIDNIDDIGVSMLSRLFGIVTAAKIQLGYFHNLNEIHKLDALLKPISIQKDDRPLVCFTGKFNTSRKELEEIYIDKGYRVTDKLNKSVQLLVVGDKPSSKLDKAKKYKIPITYLT